MSYLVLITLLNQGANVYAKLLSDDGIDVGISVLTMAEFWSRLRAEGSVDAFAEEWRVVSELLSSIHPVSLDVVSKSVELRSAATGRLPQIDALIAATILLSSTLYWSTAIHTFLRFRAACSNKKLSQKNENHPL